MDPHEGPNSSIPEIVEMQIVGCKRNVFCKLAPKAKNKLRLCKDLAHGRKKTPRCTLIYYK